MALAKSDPKSDAEEAAKAKESGFCRVGVMADGRSDVREKVKASMEARAAKYVEKVRRYLMVEMVVIKKKSGVKLSIIVGADLHLQGLTSFPWDRKRL
jgi:hypothetical protein